MSITNEYILEMRGITKDFSGVKALDEVSLKVKRGEIHAICGENGAGKSTLMNVLSGVYPYGTYSGDIMYLGEECRFKNIRESEKEGIVIIHQELTLSPFLSIGENIFIGNERKRSGLIDWSVTHTKATEVLRRVGLDESPDTLIKDIGVGKQQLVEIAKALSKEVKLLILDEPTSALNDSDSADLLALISGLRDEGVTSIIISHKLNEIKAIADSTTIIRDGHSIETLDMRGAEPVTEDRIIKSMVGRELTDRYPKHESHATADELLRVEDWTVYHPLDAERKVVDGASLSVNKGEIVGLAGIVGAGRTELAMSLFGHSYGVNISGQVYRNGQAVKTGTVDQAVEHGIAYVPEDRKRYGLNLIQKVKENVTLSGLRKIANHGLIALEKETGIAEGYRKEFNIKTSSVDLQVRNLSGGNQQKVVLAKWMYTDPEVLILDEPTRGIDVGAKYEIYQIIDDLADSGHAVLMISSELPELLGVCDRIYTVCEGRITGVMPAKEATQEKLMKLMTTTSEEATA